MLIAPVTEFEAAVGDMPETLRFARLRRETHDLSDVDVVITPLFGDGFDAIDVIDQLGAAQFRGILHVVAPLLSDRSMVLAELRDAADPLGIVVDLREQA